MMRRLAIAQLFSRRCLTLLMLCLFASFAHAGSAGYGKINVDIQDPEHVATTHGYAAYRITLHNKDQAPHRVRITLPATSYGGGDHLSHMSRTFDLAPGGTIQAEMLQPPLSMSGDNARVHIDGQLQADLPLTIVPHMEWNQHPTILLSRDLPATLRDRMDKAQEALSSGVSSGFHGSASVAYTELDLATSKFPVNEWSPRWLGYSRYTAIVLLQREVQTLPPPIAEALRNYVRTGGTLVVANDTGTAVPLAGWEPGPFNAALNDDDQGYGLGRLRWLSIKQATTDNDARWATVFIRWNSDIKLASQILTSNNAEQRLPMLDRNQGTPRRGLLAMMLLFTVLIGPVNLVMLTWWKKRMWLLWTVPLLSAIFSFAVVGYALISEGVSPRGRVMAITLLDQDAQHAITVGLLGYYAPLTPGQGLRFDADTHVAPQIRDDYSHGYGYRYNNDTGRARSLDLTHGQHLTRGWITARTPAHLAIHKTQPRRERLDITTEDDGRISVMNGLGADITRLVLRDADGQLWVADDLPAGQRVQLTLSTDRPAAQDTSALLQPIRQNGWAAVKNLIADNGQSLSPQMYLAQLDGCPFIEEGLEGMSQRETQAVVLGSYGGPH